jgi:ABC-type nitrate/sulfonate/bicarbonate transport system substrate-binding protein
MEAVILIKKIILLFTVSAFFIAALLISNNPWQQDKKAVSIAISKTPLSTPFYIAKHINAFKGTCVSVEFVEVLGGQAAFSKVMNREVDFGTSSDSVIAFQSVNTKEFVTHASFVQSDNDVKLITLLKDKINTVFDLKGKKIGVTKGTASEYFLSTLLALEGLTIENVILVDYKPEKLISALVNKEVVAIVPWEPYAFQSQLQLKNKIKIHDTKSINTLSFNLISQKADDPLVQKAKCIIQGLTLAIDYIAAHPTQSKEIVKNELNLSSDFIEWVWDDYIFKLSLNQSLIQSIKSQHIWAVEHQNVSIKALPNFNSFVDERAMLLVDPQAVNIQR